MAYEEYTGDRENEQAHVEYLMRLFHYARLQRVNFEIQWEESAALAWSEYRHTFTFGHARAPGVKWTQYMIDCNAAIDAQRFMAIADTIITPFNNLWFEVQAQEPYLQKQRPARAYFQELTRAIGNEIYRPESNFPSQNQTNLKSLAIFGNMGMMIDELETKPFRWRPGSRFMMTPPGEIYLLQNYQGAIDGFIRYFKWTASQAFGRWKNKLSPQLMKAMEAGDAYTRHGFLQFCLPNTWYHPDFPFVPGRSKPFYSCYISVEGYNILEEGGYQDFPLSYGRYSQAPEEWYGRGPMQDVLPEVKTINSVREAYLKQAVLAGDPNYLLPDDGMFDFKATAGGYTFGGMVDGKPQVGVLPHGEIQVSDEAQAKSAAIIHSAFLTDLFPLLFEQKGPQRSAREVVEMAVQQGIFLSPLARQYTEYCAPMIRRTLALMDYQRRLPKMPGVVREYLKAHGGQSLPYQTKFTSALAQSLDMPAIAGAMRTVEMASTISNAMGGNPSVFYPFNFKRMIPGIAVNQRVPEDWLSTDKEIAQQEQQAQQAAARDAQLKALPGQAAIMKAQAISDKARTGGNIGGTLSGVPEGQMPVVPGQG